MHIERLVTMANDIAAFVHGAADRNEAAQSVAMHLRRYWGPRIRRQITDYCKADGACLSELAREAVSLLAHEAKGE